MKLTAPIFGLFMVALAGASPRFTSRALAQPDQPNATASAGKATLLAVTAAQAFLATLDEATRAKAVFAFSDEVQRQKWSNLPTGIYERAGLRLGDLTSSQRESAMKALAATLSARGYQKVLEIINADQVLKEESRGGPKFGRDEFYVSILGKPSATDPWMLQFGGHHLALNVTIAGRNGVLTPSLTAAQPAAYKVDGKLVRPLGEENDAAFELVNSLDSTQRGQAILSYKVRDLVLGPGQDGKTIQPEGVKAATLSGSQKAMLLNLVSKWVDIINDEAAAAKMEEVKSNLAETYFAWSGSTNNGKPAYFRVQGPTLVIEYAPQNLGGVPTNHIHTIYRDPTNDYSKKYVKP